jgi:predicted RNA binding protein YcfA (HicA-like mRNA interferase family)
VYFSCVDSRTLITQLEALGWQHVGTTGSHWHFKHPDRRHKLSVPHPRKDLGKGLVAQILRKAEQPI